MSEIIRKIGLHTHLPSNIAGFNTAVGAAASGSAAAASGVFLPPGGTAGQTLLKDSGADGDATWHNIEDMATTETDDTLRLAPDGFGGVKWV